MQTLSEETLAAIGRVTIAAADLEHLLAAIAGDAAAVDRPGGALTAARARLASVPANVRSEFGHAIEAAATQLAISRNTLHRLWRTPGCADPAVFDAVAGHVWRCREWLQLVAGEYLGTAFCAAPPSPQLTNALPPPST